MKTALLTIGDEILIGQIADTNAQWIGAKLTDIGVDIKTVISISDKPQAIIQALDRLKNEVELIIITGGLGPTKDDLTKKTLADYFKTELESNPMVLDHIKALFEKFGYPFTKLNYEQALVPKDARVLMNHWGTAPGMWFEKEDMADVISLPGVPYEMKELMKAEVIPGIQSRFELPYRIQRNIMTTGMGESMMAEIIEPWEDALPDYISLAYLPTYGALKLRLMAVGRDKPRLIDELNKRIKDLKTFIGDQIIGLSETETLVELIAQLLKNKQETLSVAESCTGGRIAQMLTEQAGASQFFKGGIVAYSRGMKEAVLGVEKELIDTHSVVSEAVAVEMAKKIREKTGSEWGISTTGNAGPTTDKTDETLGVVYVGISCKSETYAYKFNFGQPREKVINRAAVKALELLKQEITKN
jgi:nicotinamide-nucleotide amidase